MNCYYSNLIEGHDTHPADIERALVDDYSTDPKKRDLQREARAYIAVQSWLDAGDLPDVPTSEATVRAIHARFYQELPEDLRWVTTPFVPSVGIPDRPQKATMIMPVDPGQDSTI